MKGDCPPELTISLHFLAICATGGNTILLDGEFLIHCFAAAKVIE